MNESQRTMHDAAKLARDEERKRNRATKRAEAHARLDAWVASLPVLGDPPLPSRDTPIPANDATMRGILLAKFRRPNGAHALVILREWNGQLRLLFTLLYVENGAAVRSRGWTLFLRSIADDGTASFSLADLDVLIAALASVRSRLAEHEPQLTSAIARMHADREAWKQEHPKPAGDDP